MGWSSKGTPGISRMMHLRLVLRGILWAICGDRCYLEWETWTEFRLYYTHSILCFILIDASDFPAARHQRDRRMCQCSASRTSVCGLAGMYSPILLPNSPLSTFPHLPSSFFPPMFDSSSSISVLPSSLMRMFSDDDDHDATNSVHDICICICVSVCTVYMYIRKFLVHTLYAC